MRKYLLIIAFALLTKILVLYQGLPYTNISDIQHVILGLQLSENKAGYLGIWDYSEPFKYPAFLSTVYCYVMDFMRVESYTQAIKIIRTIHFLFFVLTMCLLLFIFPSEKKYQWPAFLLFATSLTLHHYSVIERIHAVAGSLTFLTYCTALKWRMDKSWMNVFLIGVLAGLSLGTLYTGFLAIVCVCVMQWAVMFKEKLEIKHMIWKNLSFALIALFVASLFFPSAYRFIMGEGDLLNSNYFGHYYGQSQKENFKTLSDSFNGDGFFSYVESALSWDPLLWSSYLIGLFTLIKNKNIYEAKWIGALSIIIPYQAVMAISSTTQARRDSFFIPFMCLIGSYGIVNLIQRKKIVKYVFRVGVAFMAIVILKYVYLSKNFTHSQVYKYVTKNFESNCQFLFSTRLPHFHLYYEKYTDKHVTYSSIELFHEEIKRKVESQKKGMVNFSNFSYPEKLASINKIKYLVFNEVDASDLERKLTKRWRSAGIPVAQFPSHEEQAQFPRWPDDFHWMIPKLLTSSYSGPKIKIYRLDF